MGMKYLIIGIKHLYNETIKTPETNNRIFILGPSLLGAEFVRGRVCQGPSLSGAEMSRNLKTVLATCFLLGGDQMS